VVIHLLLIITKNTDSINNKKFIRWWDTRTWHR